MGSPVICSKQRNKITGRPSHTTFELFLLRGRQRLELAISPNPNPGISAQRVFFEKIDSIANRSSSHLASLGEGIGKSRRDRCWSDGTCGSLSGSAGLS